MTTSRLSAAALVAAVAVLLGACSGAEPVPAVVSVDSPPTAVTQPPTGPAPDGAGAAASPVGDAGYPSTGTQPQLRLDDPPERQAELLKIWTQCLLDNGAPPMGTEKVTVGSETRDLSTMVGEPVPDAAKAACMHLLPLQPVELEPATNPQYREDFFAYVDCLRENGFMVHVIDDTSGPPGTLSWTFDGSATAPPDDPDGAIDRTCMLQAFGGGA